jgi:hypothetical protein
MSYVNQWYSKEELDIITRHLPLVKNQDAYVHSPNYYGSYNGVNYFRTVASRELSLEYRLQSEGSHFSLYRSFS